MCVDLLVAVWPVLKEKESMPIRIENVICFHDSVTSSFLKSLILTMLWFLGSCSRLPHAHKISV